MLPPRHAATAASALEEAERQKLRNAELESVRKSADAWRGGLAGIAALVTTVALVKGKESIDEFTDTWQYIIASTMAVTLLVAAVGLFYGIRASAGDPSEWDESRLDREDGVSDLKHALALKAIGDLDIARKASFTTLGLLALLVGFTFFGEDAPPDPSKVRVTPLTGPAACGTSLGIADGQLSIETAGGNVVPVKLDTIQRIEVDVDCDG